MIQETMTLRNILPIALIAIVLVLIFVWSANQTETAHANTNGGIPVTVATTSTPTIGTTATLVFATSTCQSRVVTTYASPAMMTFGDGAGSNGGPTGIFGHLQAASTTQVYNADTYGCGALRIYQFVSTAITVTETR